MHSKFSEWIFDFFPVKLAACLKPPGRANYLTIMAYWKGATTPLGLCSTSTYNWDIAKMTFEPFQQTLLKLCNRGGMKISKMSQGRNVSKKVGNHCTMQLFNVKQNWVCLQLLWVNFVELLKNFSKKVRRKFKTADWKTMHNCSKKIL